MAPAQDISEVITERQSGTMHRSEGHVKYQPPREMETNAATPQLLNPGDSLRTLAAAWALVRLRDDYEVRLMELTRLLILPAAAPTNPAAFSLQQGQSYFKSRGPGPRIGHFQAAHLRGRTVGTEFLIAVDPVAQRAEVTMFDGQAELSDGTTNVIVPAGHQGFAIAGQGIRVRSVIEATNLVQWWLYYPGVLDPNELELSPEEQERLGASLEAYRAGDLPQALQQFPDYPTPTEPSTASQRLYLAGLYLAVGAVHRTEALLSRLPTNASGVRALRTLIEAVQSSAPTNGGRSAARQSAVRNPQSAIESASELLARSYLHQSQHRLEDALSAARAATDKSPRFGFAWERVAELEFSFGRIRRAKRALDRALELAPRNGQAHALRGFLLAAENQTKAATEAFDQAIELDPALGNAWLGRGLCCIRNAAPEIGNSTRHIPIPRAALDDLRTAALLEPNRSLLHSYLGKAFTDLGDLLHARQELDYARRLDPNDPTPWLYSALLHREQNAINPAVRDLEQSLDRNDHRAVYRSQLLLDQDRAVRSSSLANLYQTAGMPEVSLREAARAVSDDYGNYSAHLFLSESYDALRDPTRFNLRYETVWFNELLLANLLSPVGGTPLSQHVSQQEYSRLFERDRVGLTSDTEFRSDNQVRELASQFGRVGNTSWALDLDYQHNSGVRPNNGLDRIEWYSTLKQQLTAKDSVLLLTKYQDYHSGDNFQYYDWRAGVRTNFTFDEWQQPIVLGGYHREWAPGMHTLLLGGRLVNEQQLSDSPVPVLVVATNLSGQTLARPSPFAVRYQSDLEIYTAELNQIIESPRNAAVAGVRFQTGEFDTRSSQVSLTLPAFFPSSNTVATSDFHHLAAYVYDTVEVLDRLRLTAGLAYDDLRYPRNYRQVPISEGEETRSRLSPKAALVWDPRPEVTVRSAYAQSLGGVSLDESYRLEPVQLAGFSQAFRTLIPESVAGSVSAPTFETLGAAVDLKFRTGTYVTLQGEWLRSEVDRSWGVYDFDRERVPASVIPQDLDFDERSFLLVVNQLLGEEWSVGAHYRYVRDELRTRWPSLAPSAHPGFDNVQTSDLHRFGLYAMFNHPSGFFARAEANGFWQNNLLQTNNAAGSRVTAELPSDDFWQFNFWVGYRLRRGQGDLSLGLLNATDQDYHLNPLNVSPEFPHERVVAVRVRFRF